MKKKLLISITSQFGYHTDTFMYCKYLAKSKYEVHYVGFDVGYARRRLENVTVHNIPVHANKLKRYWVYVRSINRLIRKEKFDLLFLVDCQSSLLIRLSNIFQKTILDIRTGDVQLKENEFSFFNLKIRFTSLFFKRITVISDSLQQALKLPKNKCHYLPLGAEPLKLPDKSFDTFNLFYIGTIHNRNIYQTVEGLALFLKNNPDISLHYDIVGFGSEADERILKESIITHNLNEIVTFHGRKNHDEVMDLFEKCNIGFAYIPITKGYNFQPTSKFYEYVFAGMPVIATNTYENKLAMTSLAGVLIEDNPTDIARGLEDVLKNKEDYNSNRMKEKYKNSTWENIVKQHLEPYIEEIC